MHNLWFHEIILRLSTISTIEFFHLEPVTEFLLDTCRTITTYIQMWCAIHVNYLCIINYSSQQQFDHVVIIFFIFVVNEIPQNLQKIESANGGKT